MPAVAAEQEVSWTNPARKPKPPVASSVVHDVSRNSGLHANVGTFGCSSRFNDKLVGRGNSSPNGRDFYKRNALFKNPLEKGLECTQGVGIRPDMASKKMPRAVGPGSYEIIASAAKQRSPLDGPDYCLTTIHQKLPSKLVPADCCSPGPHHKYEVCKPLDHHCPSYHLPPMHHQTRHAFPEDKNKPGPGSYEVMYHLSCAESASAPDLSNPDPVKPRTVKSTFGMANRFKNAASLPTSSPNGQYYYSHYKPKDSDDYLAGARSCTFGKGGKTNFANPHNGPVFQTSPVSYSPVTSMAAKTSALDGLTRRTASPISTSCKALADLARSQRSKSMSAKAFKKETKTAVSADIVEPASS